MSTARPKIQTRMSDTICDWLPDVVKPWAAPALDGMRLAPPSDGLPTNALMLQTFTWDARHERLSWWTHLKDELPRLESMGFTQLWLPPAHKAMRPGGQGYEAYDLWDLGEFEQKGSTSTRWGSKSDLEALCGSARQHRIDIIIDAVLNHKLGADRPEKVLAVPVNPVNREQEIEPAREIEAWTIFDFPGRNGQYSSLQWTAEHFTGTDWDHKTRKNGVFRFATKGHKGWSSYVDKELGNYDYLLGVDIDVHHPDVQADMLKWGEWMLQETGATGFRLDAIKHIDRRVLRDYLTTLRSIPGQSDMFAVAEYWSANVKLILPYIRDFRGQTAFFDVPLHDNFHQASKHGEAYDLRHIFDNTVVAVRPGDAVTFVDNHDTQIGQSLESWVSGNFKAHAYALILLRSEGHPCVFYGDLYPNKECYDERTSRLLEALVGLRRTHAYGPTIDYFHEHNCIGFVRAGDEHRPGCVVTLSNANPTSAGAAPHALRMNVGRKHRGQVFCCALAPGQEVNTGPDGWATFHCQPGQVQVWVPS